MKKYFADDDNFIDIILSHFPRTKNMLQVQTGWTNYVYKVCTDNGTYFFRFPRNQFFADALEKEYNMVQFIKGKISIKTPDFTMFYNNERPYTIHKELEGQSLSECYCSLTDDEKQQLAKDICNLLDDFYKINLDKNIASLQKVSNFLDNLSLVSQNGYNLSKHDKLKELENQHLVFSHGDFNPGNLILKNNKLEAIIDFSFSGISNELLDLSRLIGRCPSDFAPLLLTEYQKHNKINTENVNLLVQMWQYVEEKYILYIKQNHPSIVLPTLK